MADNNRVSLTADGKKTTGSDAAFVYDAADADRAAEALKNAAANADSNERAVRDGLTTVKDGVRVRNESAAAAAAADGSEKSKK